MKNFLFELMFASTGRSLAGERWFNITLRTLHLVGVAGASAAFLQGAPHTSVLPFLYLMLCSGVLLSLLYFWTHGAWLLQLSGISILIKVALLLVAIALPTWQAPLFILIIIISGLIAHAPARVRGYRLLTRGIPPNL